MFVKELRWKRGKGGRRERGRGRGREEGREGEGEGEGERKGERGRRVKRGGRRA